MNHINYTKFLKENDFSINAKPIMDTLISFNYFKNIDPDVKEYINIVNRSRTINSVKTFNMACPLQAELLLLLETQVSILEKHFCERPLTLWCTAWVVSCK